MLEILRKAQNDKKVATYRFVCYSSSHLNRDARGLTQTITRTNAENIADLRRYFL